MKDNNQDTLKDLYIRVLKHNWKIGHCKRIGEEEYRIIDLCSPLNPHQWVIFYLYPPGARRIGMGNRVVASREIVEE